MKQESAHNPTLYPIRNLISTDVIHGIKIYYFMSAKVEEGISTKQLTQLKAKTENIVSSFESILSSDMDYKSLIQILKTTTASYESLLEELYKSNLEQTIVHPHLLIQADPEFYSRVLLRTKLIPELEEEALADHVYDELEVDKFNEQVQVWLDILLDVKLELETRQKQVVVQIDDTNLEEVLKFMAYN